MKIKYENSLATSSNRNVVFYCTAEIYKNIHFILLRVKLDKKNIFIYILVLSPKIQKKTFNVFYVSSFMYV